VRLLTNPRVWLATLLLVAAVVSFRVRVTQKMPDFEVYRTAAIRALAGEQLYRIDDGHWQFKYLPAFALAAMPIAVVPQPVARAAWFAVSVGLLVALLTVSVRLLPPLPDRSTGMRHATIVALTVVALGKFYAHELELGQTNVLMALLVLLALARWREGRHAWAGVLFAAATIVKPYAIIFLPYLVVRRQWRLTAAFAGAMAVALVLPALRYGVSANAALLHGWWTTVTMSTPPNVAVSDNISLAAMYAKWLGVGPLASGLAVATAGLVVAGCAVLLGRRPTAEHGEYLDAAVLLTLIPLLSPQGWDYVLLVSTPAVMLLLSRLGSFSAPARGLAVACLAIVGLTIFDVVGRTYYYAFMKASVVTLCALVELALLARLRAIGRA
jgi:hypothetical protein